MGRKGLIILVGLLLIIAIGLVAFVMLPQISRAPTGGEQGTVHPGGLQAKAAIEDLISVSTPLPHASISSPVTISGDARGSWYFEATAPVILKDASGVVIAHGTIRATQDWMTADFVPFTGTLTFTAPATKTGTLVLMNDNPSGDPSRQKELDIPVNF
jgi:hypothetical protein